MQVTQTLDEGLKREFKVVVPAQDLDARLNERLATLKDRVNINGFRKGKVPVAHLKKLYGKSVMAEVVEQTVAEANKKIVDDNGLKLAMQPKITLPQSQEEVEGVISGASDLSVTVELEVLPTIELKDVAELKLDKLVAEVADSEVDEAVERVAKQNAAYAAKAEGEGAANGDRLTIDFVGKIDGEPFDGGSAEGQQIEIGAGRFIPGFEEQLVGATAGEQRVLNVTFPADYGADHLAGKAATFDVTVTAVEAPGEIKIDDELAKSLGLDDLAALKATIREQIASQYAQFSRQKVKRELLDALDAQYDFDLPPTLVEQEFDNVWRQVVADLERNGRSFADEDTTEDDARAEYRKISERRVRLGLVLAEIGEKHEVKVTDDEVTRALIERARQFPGQERQVWDFYRQSPEALAELRAPIFEDKVVDQILGQATVTERQVSKEELMADPDADEADANGGRSAEDRKAAQRREKRAAAKAAAQTETNTDAEPSA
ncbi:trigger factor [Methylopila jiangsuensis]|uniref:Trigger factor n=1 Tax=Methylopila jiangsuensis TaxID=586230 RepID=A0A9W6JG67_9HYPH|nr:trigger factor [Methylopila jiangsuensis]MDR6285659.1 trigger factor [Methylopila jiangsuensis]GLK75419.1 trigger factor [Methylopila jiangsuensis]